MSKKYYSLVTNNGDRTADLYIFGDIVDAWNTGIDEAIGWDIGEVSGLSIAKDLNALTDIDQINVHINSMGGYTAEGLAIFNILKNHPAKVVTYCDGFACSAASIIFMAGDERVMGSASALMIHNAWSEAQGNAAQLRQSADVLDKISKAAGNAYMTHVTISREELDAMSDGENHEGTWVLPEEAVSMGFATSIAEEETSSVANQSVSKMIISRMTAKVSSTEPQQLDPEDVAERIFQKVLDKAKSEDREPELKKGLNNFLEALSKCERSKNV